MSSSIDWLLSGISLGSGRALGLLLALEAKSTRSTEIGKVKLTSPFPSQKSRKEQNLKETWTSKSSAAVASSNVSNIICISVHDSHSDLLGVCPLSLSQTLKFSWITKLCWHLFNLLITVHYMCLPVMKEQINAVWFGFLSGDHESEPYIWFEAPFDFNNYLPYLSIRVLHSKWDCFVW